MTLFSMYFRRGRRRDGLGEFCSRVERGNGEGEDGDGDSITIQSVSVHSTSTGFARIGMRTSPLGSREG